MNGGFTQAVLAGLGNALGTSSACSAATRTRTTRSPRCDALTAAAWRRFNASYPAGVPATALRRGRAVGERHPLYSWSGTGVLTNVLDIGDPALGVSSLFYNESNDGLVERCSSHLGS